MGSAHHKAIIINDWWAGILGTIIAACFLGSISFAWSANSEQAVLQDKVRKMEEANLPERMARIEETVKSTDKTVDDIKAMQRDMGRKIDILVQSQIENRGSLRPSR